MGDEYFANLDHIESVENFKEGYESDAPCSSDSSGVDLKDQEDGNSGTEDPEESNDDSSDDNFCKDEDFSTSSVWRSYATRRQTRGQKENGSSETMSKDSRPPDLGPPHIPIPSAVPTGGCKPPSSEDTPKNKVASWLSCNNVSESGFADSDSRSSFKTSEGGGGKGETEKVFKDDGDIKQAKKEVSKQWQETHMSGFSHVRSVWYGITLDTIALGVFTPFFVLVPLLGVLRLFLALRSGVASGGPYG